MSTKKSKKKILVVAAIIAGALAVVAGVSFAIAHNNKLANGGGGGEGGSDDDDCMCAPPPGVKECSNCDPGMDYKPIIYLYPTAEAKITVKLGYPELITAEYPSYKSGWSVIAKPDGTLKIGEKEYYALYYESKNKVVPQKTDTGFVVKSDDVSRFLEEKLSILGLNERESEEFIIYWLPKLQKKDYVYIRFATNDEIAKNMPLKITPEPDTTIRVLMLWQGLDKSETVKEQALAPVARNGYTAVEWGGTELK